MFVEPNPLMDARYSSWGILARCPPCLRAISAAKLAVKGEDNQPMPLSLDPKFSTRETENG